MEQDPNLFFEKPKAAGDELPSSERLFSSPESKSPEAKKRPSASKSFEELVHEALEDELKFERDPALRNQASRRADEILAEFQEAKTTPKDNPLNTANDQDIPNSNPPTTSQNLRPSPTGQISQNNYRLADFILISVIAILLLIIVLMLIF